MSPSIRARDVIEPALRLLGIASAEEPVEAFAALTALGAFNAMLDAWSIDRLLVPRRPGLTLTLQPGKQVYTWGLDPADPAPADLSSPAPVRLELCLLTVPGVPPQEWEIAVLDQHQYETGISLKQQQGGYVEAVYLDPIKPVSALYVWPLPSMPCQLQLFPWPALPLYPLLDSAVDWPEGYVRTFQLNLAVDLAPQYLMEASPTVQRLAEQSRLALSPVNAQVVPLQLWPRAQPVSSGWARFQRGG